MAREYIKTTRRRNENLKISLEKLEKVKKNYNGHYEKTIPKYENCPR